MQQMIANQPRLHSRHHSAVAICKQSIAMMCIFFILGLLGPTSSQAQNECADALPKQIKGTGKYLMSEYTGGGCYEGSLENWQRTGFGKHVLGGARAVMVGNWRKSELHGYGEVLLHSGFKRGEFANGELNGFGIQQVANWDPFAKRWGEVETYEGEWSKGVRQGFGVLTRTQRDLGGTLTYEGEFRQGFANGQGELKNYPNVSDGTYIGDVKTTYIENRGYVIMRHGRGTFFGKNGEILSGEWANDKATRVKAEALPRN